MTNIKSYADERAELCLSNDRIPDEQFKQYGVNRGLRDIHGKGVLTGLTNISKIKSFENL